MKKRDYNDKNRQNSPLIKQKIVYLLILPIFQKRSLRHMQLKK